MDAQRALYIIEGGPFKHWFIDLMRRANFIPSKSGMLPVLFRVRFKRRIHLKPERKLVYGHHPSDDLSEKVGAAEFQQPPMLGQSPGGNCRCLPLTAESKWLYALMRDAVDREMQVGGYLPDATTYEMHSPGDVVTQREGEASPTESAAWKCSDKQKQLIEKIVLENDLDKREIEGLSREMFGTGVKQLNRLQASGLLDELLERHGGQLRNGAKIPGNGYRSRLPRETRGCAR